MTRWDPVELTRDCAATTVPYGEQVTLDAGGLVEVVQRLGASITVRTEMGSLLRIDSVDADALGLDPIDVDVDVARRPARSRSVTSSARCKASTTRRSRSASSNSVSSTAATRSGARTVRGGSRSTCR